MSVSMISVDLDGTLLLNDKTISERTILAARSAMARRDQRHDDHGRARYPIFDDGLFRI